MSHQTSVIMVKLDDIWFTICTIAYCFVVAFWYIPRFATKNRIAYWLVMHSTQDEQRGN